MILEGKPIAEKIYDGLVIKTKKLIGQGITPHLAVILVGHREDSEIFVKIKEKKAREIGIEFSLYRFLEDETEENILLAIDHLNNDEDIHGIIVQLPLPDKLDTEKILNKVEENKDVDGLMQNSPYLPPAPMAIIRLLDEYSIDTQGEKIVIVGKGRLVGQPLERLLKEKGLNVLAVDMETDDLIEKIRQADVLISATGTPGVITKELVHKNSVVIDAANDVNFDQIKDNVESLTPTKGGVGPITVALLLANVVEAAEKTLN